MSLITPQIGDLVIMQSVRNQFQLLTHDDESNKCFLELYERYCHDFKKSIIPDEFLDEHCIHGLFVIGRINFRNFIYVPNRRRICLHK